MKKGFVTIIALFWAVTLIAQNVHNEVLTFEQALAKTRENNGALKASRYESEAAVKEKKAAFGLHLPNVGVTGVYTLMSEDIKFDLNGAKSTVGDLASGLFPPAAMGQLAPLMKKDWSILLQDDNFGMVGANFTMPLYMGGKINAANRAARIRVDEVAARSVQTENQIVSQLVERYFGVVLAGQVVIVRGDVLKGMEEHLKDAVSLERNGSIAKTERLYAEMKVAQARKEYQKSVRDLATLKAALRSTINEENDFTPLTPMFVDYNIKPLSFFQSAALESNPQLKQLDLKQNLAKEGVRAQRAEFLPQVAVMGTYDIYNYQLSHVVPRWVVGAGIKINLFDGLNKEYKYSAARSTVKQVEALTEKANSDILTLVEKLHNELLTSADQITEADAALAFATEYTRVKTKAFAEGAATSTDVVDAMLNLSKIRIERLQTAYSYDVMLAQLLEICGMSSEFNNYMQSGTSKIVKFE